MCPTKTKRVPALSYDLERVQRKRLRRISRYNAIQKVFIRISAFWLVSVAEMAFPTKKEKEKTSHTTPLVSSYATRSSSQRVASETPLLAGRRWLAGFMA